MNQVSKAKGIVLTLYPDGRLDAKSASAYVGLSQKTLAQMRSQGRGPRFVKRGKVFYFKDDLDAWIAEGRFISTTQAALNGSTGKNRRAS